MKREKVLALLSVDQLPGTPDQLDMLCIRIRELTELNGEDWVRRNRRKLLDQWETFLDQND